MSSDKCPDEKNAPGFEPGAMGSKESLQAPHRRQDEFSLHRSPWQANRIALFVRVAGTEPVLLMAEGEATKADIEQAIRFLNVLKELAT